MNEQQLSKTNNEVRASDDRARPEWAVRATAASQREWSSDCVLDQGDTHDKGESSLCVGEAA